ncbi:MAG: hypothetical protein M1812_006202 [Candelaria pacifica]|nr:MAG: hypothetical protein M1812_006202 [Candelaria pacifica]
MQSPTPPNELAVPGDMFKHEGLVIKSSDIPSTPPNSASISRTSSNTASQPRMQIKRPFVNLIKPAEPRVTWIETLRFIWWSILVILTQLWRDLSSGKFYKPLLSTDFMPHYFYIPAGRQDPRLVTSGPHNRMTIRNIPASTTRQYEEIPDLSIFPETETINCASNNYGGFSRLEASSMKVVEAGLRSLPFCPPPQLLEDHVKSTCAGYMGFDEAFTAPSGFSTNVLAFATVAGVAAKQGRGVVFMMDRDCHNSMFTGAFYNKGAKVHKFNHNDLGDLEFKLRCYREQDPMAFVCVAVEGIYSMEGSISPGPAILALKRVYNFCLLIDEAHSFLALGSGGKGSFNHWQDAGYDCPLRSVDVMSCMFSKSVGCTGGFVLANGPFAGELQTQGKSLINSKIEKLSTVILLRILSLLKKPMFIQHRMGLVREKAEYVARALSAAGCTILSSPGSAIICFPVGTVRQVTLFHGEAQKMGMAIVGGVPPATPMWGCRIRICIFATTTWPDIYKLLTTTITIAQKLRIRGVQPTTFDTTLLERVDHCDELVTAQSNTVDAQLLEFVSALSAKTPLSAAGNGSSTDVIEAGVQGLHRYGIGPCSARWFYGSFDAFIHLEQRLAHLYPSLALQCGDTCRAMICGDAEVTTGSTVTALAMPTASRKKNNTIFVYAQAPKSILDGAAVAKETKNVTRKYYESVDDIPGILELHKPTHVTFYFLTCNPQGDSILDLHKLFTHQIFVSGTTASNITGITIMLDDRHGLGRIGPHKLGYLDHMEATQGGKQCLVNTFQKMGKMAKKIRIIVAGSWYDAFGHQGGYVTGHKDTVEALTWDAKAYFFSTPPMPLQAMMTDKAIEVLQRGRDERGGGEKGRGV